MKGCFTNFIQSAKMGIHRSILKLFFKQTKKMPEPELELRKFCLQSQFFQLSRHPDSISLTQKTFRQKKFVYHVGISTE